MAVVFERPKALLDVPMHFCPGCGHGIVHRLGARLVGSTDFGNFIEALSLAPQ